MSSFTAMKTKTRNEALTFGDLIENFYNIYGKRRAKGFLRLVVEAQLVVFPGCQRYALSREKGTA